MRKVKKQTVPADELLIKNEIIGLGFLIVAIFLLFCLVGYHPSDPSYFQLSPQKGVQNYAGRSGAEISAFLYNFFGYGSFIFVVYFLFISSYFFINRKIKNLGTKSFGYVILFLSFSPFISLLNPYSTIGGREIKTGGMMGYFLSEFFKTEIKPFLTFILFFSLMVVALILIAKFSIRKILQLLMDVFMKVGNFVMIWIRNQIARIKKYQRMRRIQNKYKDEPAVKNKKTVEPEGDPEIKIFKEKKKIVKEPSKIPEESYLFSELDKSRKTSRGYKPPPLTYLDSPTERSKIDYKELEEKKEDLANRLNEFRIRGKIVEYTPGPVITTYEFVPDVGIKVKDVTNLSEDLALVAKAQYVRIERILGKKAIGIEIPNKKREIIHLREILESEEFQRFQSPLAIGLGKTKSGEIFVTDMREMPHLIIAGATGSGKSVAIHTFILSILYKSSPEEVKFVLIDPKRVELAIYNSLPHLLTPVVVNTKLAKNALDWAVYEMEMRYKKLFILQVRNIEQYNKKLEMMIQSEDEGLDKLEDQEKIPYIVIVIDEFADLMMECSREIEDNVARIAQKARAVGIHLILATQRPSIDVITGTIKNNFPSRIALAVPSKHDSRTIIDIMGAEKLLGHGDMLFLPPKTATLVRLHCAYVSEEEAMRAVNFLAKLERPKYNTQIVKPKKKEGADGDRGELDGMFYDAARLVIETGQASASYLQRRMSIGYARAGRLMDQLQNNGVVSSPNSKNQRQILMSIPQLEEMETEDE